MYQVKRKIEESLSKISAGSKIVTKIGSWKLFGSWKCEMFREEGEEKNGQRKAYLTVEKLKDIKHQNENRIEGTEL